MATYVDTEEREEARLRQAEEEGLSQLTMTPVIKECLRLKILSDRHSQGLPEYQKLFAEPVIHELRDDEKVRLERRRQQNKEAARRCRQKKKIQKTAIENAYDQEVRLKTDLGTEIAGLQQELDDMQTFLHNHLKSGTCLITHVSDPDLLPQTAPSDPPPSVVNVLDSLRQFGDFCPPETHQLDREQHQEQQQQQQQQHLAITSNLDVQLIKRHGQTFQILQGHARTVSDNERHFKDAETLITSHEGATANWSNTQHHNCEPLQDHVSSCSVQVPQFTETHSAMPDVTSCPSTDSQFYKGVSQELPWTLQTPNDVDTSPHTLNRNLEGRVGSYHNPGPMVDSANSTLTVRGDLGSDQLHLGTPPPSNPAAMPQLLECDDTSAEAAEHHTDHIEVTTRADIFQEGFANLILEELYHIPDDLNGMYTAAGTGTNLTSC